MNTKNKIKKIEENTFLEDDYSEVPPSDIVAYNELRSCADLYRMYESQVLNISPEFQREIVWPDSSQTRFIDSLIKQLPIPSMCFSLDYKTQKWQVIDGLQRMHSIIRFLNYENSDWNLSHLKDIDQTISGKLVSQIKKTNRIFFSRLENLTIPITVIRCDYSKKNHAEYLFTIFHRLNTGGMKLNNQEIRNAIFSGPFNNLLKECNKDKQWMELLGLRKNVSYRFMKEELILRFFAFYDRYKKYKGSLTTFLNNYMFDNRTLKLQQLNEKRDLFKNTVEIIFHNMTKEKSIEKTSNVFIEALLFGVGKNIKYLANQKKEKLVQLFNQLKIDDNFSEENLREGLASKVKVHNRLTAAKKIFSKN